jgi:hypothetical protein
MIKETGGLAPTFFTDTHAASMTLRDYFAAKAMQGIISSGNLPKSVQNEEIAHAAYQSADAMLKAREQ